MLCVMLKGGMFVQKDYPVFERLLYKKKVIQQTTANIDQAISKRNSYDQYDEAIQGMNELIYNMLKK